MDSETINENIDKENTIEDQNPDGDQETEQKAILKPGEKFFTGFLLLAGIFFFREAIQLWQGISPPRNSSAAVIPLIMTGLWVVLTLITFIQVLRNKTPLSGLAWKNKIWGGLQYVFPKEVLVVLGAIAVYCMLLLFRFSFYLVTVVFLYGIMCYLTRKGFLKNILWTALVMVFTVVVFSWLFNIRFP